MPDTDIHLTHLYVVSRIFGRSVTITNTGHIQFYLFLLPYIQRFSRMRELAALVLEGGLLWSIVG